MAVNKFETYNKEVMKRFMNPKNMGEIKNPDGIGQVGNMKCGDIMKVYLKMDKDKKKIKDIKFQTFGCVAAIASSDALCDAAKGKTIAQAKKISNDDIIKELGNLPIIKLHCSVLGAGALKAAIANYEGVEYKEKEHDHKCVG
ncbi:MAG: iron-sulfur cluster assembly scaffold protein [archaeon]